MSLLPAQSVPLSAVSANDAGPAGLQALPATSLDCQAPVLGRMGSLITRLARSPGEIEVAQEIRFEVFHREMGALAGPAQQLSGRDEDAFDAICDHLLVIDEEHARLTGGPGIVGTYRFLRGSVARRCASGFYSAREFDIEPMLARHSNLEFMELGRSCVLPQWRTRRTIELLWQGTWAFVLANRIDVMFGCASFPGTDPDMLAAPLSFLFHHAPAEPGWETSAVAGVGVAMDRIAPDAIDTRQALHALPPLIKGYLRLGAMFGREAVVDEAFATTDVLVILPVARLNPRYVRHYGADAGRLADRAADRQAGC